MQELLSRPENRVVGARQTLRSIVSGNAKAVFLASDAALAITAAVDKAAGDANVPVEWVDTMEMLGRLCRLQVSAAAAAILKHE
jgi:large subunit ribosomal protein L7A